MTTTIALMRPATCTHTTFPAVACQCHQLIGTNCYMVIMKVVTGTDPVPCPNIPMSRWHHAKTSQCQHIEKDHHLLPQVLRNWRPHLEAMSAPQLLRQYSVHGLLLAGGVLLGKLTRYSLYHSMQTRLEACRMGAMLLNAIFASSIIHPQRQVRGTKLHAYTHLLTCCTYRSSA